jgi:hypothetical protein
VTIAPDRADKWADECADKEDSSIYLLAETDGLRQQKAQA